MSGDLYQTASVLILRDGTLISGWSAGDVLLESISWFPFTQKESS